MSLFANLEFPYLFGIRITCRESAIACVVPSFVAVPDVTNSPYIDEGPCGRGRREVSGRFPRRRKRCGLSNARGDGTGRPLLRGAWNPGPLNRYGLRAPCAQSLAAGSSVFFTSVFLLSAIGRISTSFSILNSCINCA